MLSHWLILLIFSGLLLFIVFTSKLGCQIVGCVVVGCIVYVAFTYLKERDRVNRVAKSQRNQRLRDVIMAMAQAKGPGSDSGSKG